MFYHSRMRSSDASALEIFFSYSHHDAALRDQLETHLALLKREGEIRLWHDRRIDAGRDWQQEIDAQLESADLILLLISSDFIASNYCYGREMTRALERHEAGEARVIPILLRPADWQTAPFAHLQALPSDGEPITAWSDRDAAFVDVVAGIRGAIADLRGRRSPDRPAPSRTPEERTADRRSWPLAIAGFLLAVALIAYLTAGRGGAVEPDVTELEQLFAGEATRAEVVGRLALRLVEHGDSEGIQVGFDHRFITADFFQFEVTSSRDGWLYLYHRPPDGRLELMWPARDETQANAVRARQPLVVPTGGDALRFTGDIGEEYFYVALTAAPSAAPTISEVQERMGQIETFIASDLQASVVPGQRRGVIVARPETAPYLYFLARRDATLAAIELKLQHAR